MAGENKSGIGLNYSNIYGNSTDTTVIPTSTGGGGSWLDSLFSNSGQLLGGIGNIITSLKTDPNAQNQNQSFLQGWFTGAQQNGNNQQMNMSWLWPVLILIAVIAVLYFVFRGKNK